MLDLEKAADAFDRLRQAIESDGGLADAVLAAQWLARRARRLAAGDLSLSHPPATMRVLHIANRSSAEVLVRAVDAIPGVQGGEDQRIVDAYSSLCAAMVYLIMKPIFADYDDLISTPDGDADSDDDEPKAGA